MADYSYPNGRFAGIGRDGASLRWRGWIADSDRVEDGDPRKNDSTVLSRYEVSREHICRPVIIGSDGRAAPAVVFDYPRHPPHKDDRAATGFPGGGGNDKADAYRAQEFISDVQTAASNGGGTRLGFPSGMFGRQRADYGSYDVDRYNKGIAAAEETNNGGRFRPSRSPEEKLGKATNNIETAATVFPRGVARPVSAAMDGSGAWSSPTPYTLQPASKRSSTTTVIDSREAAKKYGGQFVW